MPWVGWANLTARFWPKRKIAQNFRQTLTESWFDPTIQQLEKKLEREEEQIIRKDYQQQHFGHSIAVETEVSLQDDLNLGGEQLVQFQLQPDTELRPPQLIEPLLTMTLKSPLKALKALWFRLMWTVFNDQFFHYIVLYWTLYYIIWGLLKCDTTPFVNSNKVLLLQAINAIDIWDAATTDNVNHLPFSCKNLSQTSFHFEEDLADRELWLAGAGTIGRRVRSGRRFTNVKSYLILTYTNRLNWL